MRKRTVIVMIMIMMLTLVSSALFFINSALAIGDGFNAPEFREPTSGCRPDCRPDQECDERRRICVATIIDCGAQSCAKINESCESNNDCDRYGGGVEVGPGICSRGYCFLNPLRLQRYQEAATAPLSGIRMDVQIKKPILEINIPQLTFSDVASNVDSEGYLHLPWIGEYLTALYKFALGVVTIFAVVMIMKQGFDVVLSRGGEEKVNAYKKVASVIIGVAIAWGSYAILYNINPDLVRFKALKVKYIKQIPMNLAEVETEEAADQVESPHATVGRIKRVKTEFMVNTMQVGEHLEQIIQNVAQELFNETRSLRGGPFKLSGGGYRPIQGSEHAQVEKWVRQCEGKARCGTPVCNPFPREMIENQRRKPGAVPDAKLCPHTTGQALDIYCEGGSIRQFFAPCQRKLEEIMIRKGFCRLSSEPWHFENPKLMGSCTNITGRAQRRATGEVWDYSTCNGTYNMRTKQCTNG